MVSTQPESERSGIPRKTCMVGTRGKGAIITEGPKGAKLPAAFVRQRRARFPAVGGWRAVGPGAWGGLFALAGPFCVEAAHVFGEGAAGNRVAQVTHQVLVIVQVVDGGEAGAQDFVEPVEVVQIAPGEVLAGVA